MKHEEFEKEVMSKLLNDDSKLLLNLMEQYRHANIVSREFTGKGFFTKFYVDENLCKYSSNGKVDDVMAVFPDSEVYYFILYVTNGKIDTLEGFSTLDEWKDNYKDVEIKYCFDARREYDLSE